MCLALPGKVLTTDRPGTPDGTARVSFGGVIKEISSAFVPDVVVGDYVLVHAGFALSIVDEVEAEFLLQSLAEAANDPPASSP